MVNLKQLFSGDRSVQFPGFTTPPKKKNDLVDSKEDVIFNYGAPHTDDDSVLHGNTLASTTVASPSALVSALAPAQHGREIKNEVFPDESFVVYKQVKFSLYDKHTGLYQLYIDSTPICEAVESEVKSLFRNHKKSTPSIVSKIFESVHPAMKAEELKDSARSAWNSKCLYYWRNRRAVNTAAGKNFLTGKFEQEIMENPDALYTFCSTDRLGHVVAMVKKIHGNKPTSSDAAFYDDVFAKWQEDMEKTCGTAIIERVAQSRALMVLESVECTVEPSQEELDEQTFTPDCDG